MSTSRYPIAVALSCVVVALLSILGGYWLGEPLAWVIGPMIVLVLLALALVYARQIEILRALPRQQERQLHQIQSLLDLAHQLGGELSLPALGGAAMLPDAAAELARLIERERPALVLELGSGTSTVVVCQMLKRLGGGRLVALEHDEGYAARTRAELTRRGLADVGEVVHAPLEAVALGEESRRWYRTGGILPDGIDLVVVDGPPRKSSPLARLPALPVLAPHLSPRATLFLDDAARSDERTIVELWLARFPEFEVEWLPTSRGTVLLRRRADGADDSTSAQAFQPA